MPSFATGRELAGLRGLLGRVGTATGALAMPDIFNQGKSGSLLDRSLRSIPSTSKTDAGRALGNTLWNELQYMGGQLQKGSLPYLGNEMRYVTNALTQGRTPYGKPLNTSNPSRNPGANSLAPVPGGAPAERAYQRAKTQTAVQVAADPLLQKWEAARQAKDYATSDQLGQQIWQNEYGATRMGQPGGAVGSFNPLMQSTFGYQAGMSPREISQTITNPSPAPVAPGEAPLQTGDLGTRAMGLYGYDSAAYGVTPERIKEIEAELLKRAKK